MYKLTDTIHTDQPPRFMTHQEVMRLAHELYCEIPEGEELAEANKVIDSIEKAKVYIFEQIGDLVEEVND